MEKLDSDWRILAGDATDLPAQVRALEMQEVIEQIAAQTSTLTQAGAIEVQALKVMDRAAWVA